MKVVALIPVFNHGRTLARVVEGLRRTCPHLPLIIVNDGSTDDTPTVAAALSALSGRELEPGGEGAGEPPIRLLTLPANQGKGRALQMGFRHAEAAGFTHVVTLDADGQHDPGDVPRLLEASAAHPFDLIIGRRDRSAGVSAAGVPATNVPPAASLLGRRLARFWLQVQTGQDIPDSQCGLRVYPLPATLRAPCWFGRYDYETEILARLAWGGVIVRSVPIRCIYFSGQARISHFRPVMDTLRGIRVNVILTLRRIVPWPFVRLVPRHKPMALVQGSWWRLGTWRAVIRRMLATGSSNAQLSTALAVGVFVGVTPTFPLQTLIALYLAQRLHLNLLAALLGSQISIPPLMVLWLWLSVQVGHLLLQGQWLTTESARLAGLSWHTAGDLGAALALGSLVVALAASALSLIAARAVLRVMRPRGAAIGDVVALDSDGAAGSISKVAP